MRSLILATGVCLALAGCCEQGNVAATQNTESRSEAAILAGEKHTWPNGSWLRVDALAKGPVDDIDSGAGEGLCTVVHFMNNGEHPVSIDPTDFDIAYPDKTRSGSSNAAPTDGRELPMTDLHPGGEVAGSICFRDAGQSGVHQVIYEPLGQHSPVVWNSQVD